MPFLDTRLTIISVSDRPVHHGRKKAAVDIFIDRVQNGFEEIAYYTTFTYHRYSSPLPVGHGEDWWATAMGDGYRRWLYLGDSDR